MARYTTFEALLNAANYDEDGRESVWLQDCGKRLEVYHAVADVFDFLLDTKHVNADTARDLFNLEMRVYGWVSTDRTDGRLTRDY